MGQDQSRGGSGGAGSSNSTAPRASADTAPTSAPALSAPSLLNQRFTYSSTSKDISAPVADGGIITVVSSQNLVAAPGSSELAASGEPMAVIPAHTLRPRPLPRNEMEERLVRIPETVPLLPRRERSLLKSALGGGRKRQSKIAFLGDDRVSTRAVVRLCAAVQCHMADAASSTARSQKELAERCRAVEREAAVAASAHHTQLLAAKKLCSDLRIVPRLTGQLKGCQGVLADCAALAKVIDTQLADLLPNYVSLASASNAQRSTAVALPSPANMKSSADVVNAVAGTTPAVAELSLPPPSLVDSPSGPDLLVSLPLVVVPSTVGGSVAGVVDSAAPVAVPAIPPSVVDLMS